MFLTFSRIGGWALSFLLLTAYALFVLVVWLTWLICDTAFTLKCVLVRLIHTGPAGGIGERQFK